MTGRRPDVDCRRAAAANTSFAWMLPQMTTVRGNRIDISWGNQRMSAKQFHDIYMVWLAENLAAKVHEARSSGQCGQYIGCTLDISRNTELASEPRVLRSLLALLAKHRVAPTILKLFRMDLDDKYITVLCDYMNSSMPKELPIAELHLSHNQLTSDGAWRLLEVAFECGHYPPKSENTRTLWLRLEKNFPLANQDQLLRKAAAIGLSIGTKEQPVDNCTVTMPHFFVSEGTAAGSGAPAPIKGGKGKGKGKKSSYTSQWADQSYGKNASKGQHQQQDWSSSSYDNSYETYEVPSRSNTQSSYVCHKSGAAPPVAAAFAKSSAPRPAPPPPPPPNYGPTSASAPTPTQLAQNYVKASTAHVVTKAWEKAPPKSPARAPSSLPRPPIALVPLPSQLRTLAQSVTTSTHSSSTGTQAQTAKISESATLRAAAAKTPKHGEPRKFAPTASASSTARNSTSAPSPKAAKASRDSNDNGPAVPSTKARGPNAQKKEPGGEVRPVPSAKSSTRPGRTAVPYRSNAVPYRASATPSGRTAVPSSKASTPASRIPTPSSKAASQSRRNGALSSRTAARSTRDAVPSTKAESSSRRAASARKDKRARTDSHSSNTGATSRKDGDATPRKDGDATPRKCSDAAPQKYGDVAARKCSDAAPQKYGDAAPRKYGDAAPQKYGDAAPRKYGDAVPQKYGDAAPQKYGDAAPRKYGHAGPRNYGDTASRKDGDVSPRKDGDASWRKYSSWRNESTSKSPVATRKSPIPCVSKTPTRKKSPMPCVSKTPGYGRPEKKDVPTTSTEPQRAASPKASRNKLLEKLAVSKAKHRASVVKEPVTDLDSEPDVTMTAEPDVTTIDDDVWEAVDDDDVVIVDDEVTASPDVSVADGMSEHSVSACSGKEAKFRGLDKQEGEWYAHSEDKTAPDNDVEVYVAGAGPYRAVEGEKPSPKKTKLSKMDAVEAYYASLIGSHSVADASKKCNDVASDPAPSGLGRATVPAYRKRERIKDDTSAQASPRRDVRAPEDEDPVQEPPSKRCRASSPDLEKSNTRKQPVVTPSNRRLPSPPSWKPSPSVDKHAASQKQQSASTHKNTVAQTKTQHKTTDASSSKKNPRPLDTKPSHNTVNGSNHVSTDALLAAHYDGDPAFTGRSEQKPLAPATVNVCAPSHEDTLMAQDSLLQAHYAQKEDVVESATVSADTRDVAPKSACESFHLELLGL